MQNYSHALDVDTLNRRYWHRRMQQCKAEFKSNPSRSSTPKSLPNSVNRSSNLSFDAQTQSSPRFKKSHHRSASVNAMDASQSRPSSKNEMHHSSQNYASSSSERLPYPDEQPSQPDPRLTSDKNTVPREHPVPSSKSSRPIKYQVR
ncbi:MAG: hypothetical protein AAGD25_37585 [Cyanobacteria bacterium P01_F01_bin.150]